MIYQKKRCKVPEDIVTVIVLGDKLTFKLLEDQKNIRNQLSKEGMSPKEFFTLVEELLIENKIQKVNLNVINNITLDINNY